MFISRHTLKWTKTCRSSGDFPHAHTAHFLLNRHSLNARLRRSVRARGHFPDERAALKRLYLTARSLDPTGKGQVKRAARWKPALNAFAITFADRWPDDRNN